MNHNASKGVLRGENSDEIKSQKSFSGLKKKKSPQKKTVRFWLVISMNVSQVSTVVKSECGPRYLHVVQFF